MTDFSVVYFAISEVGANDHRRSQHAKGDAYNKIKIKSNTLKYLPFTFYFDSNSLYPLNLFCHLNFCLTSYTC